MALSASKLTPEYQLKLSFSSRNNLLDVIEFEETENLSITIPGSSNPFALTAIDLENLLRYGPRPI